VRVNSDRVTPSSISFAPTAIQNPVTSTTPVGEEPEYVMELNRRRGSASGRVPPLQNQEPNAR
jgi:hypothetical protein